jgi:hypothetical protein
MDSSKLRRRIGRPGLIAIGVAILLVSSVIQASAVHGLATLSGSNFEIDNDANLKNDDGAPFVDWADLAHPDGPELRATDAATGQNDDSYKGGVKEDTQCPGETTGSIPNNKSDLLTFHVYEEPGDPGFLNLAWSRVSDPSGTTLMDFEFNQSTDACSVGPNVVRTEGDLLLEYAIDQGGARAEISGRFWTGTAWGPALDLDDGTDCDGGPCAVGTINTSVIPAADADGLGLKQPRTFGEAQIDLDLIFDEDKCTSFGSAMLKSRSSDAFTSQLKDFISPVPINLNNCAQVIIRKQTIPDGEAGTFNFSKTFPTDLPSGDTFSLEDDGVKDYGKTVLFGTGLEASEDLTTLPAGFVLDDIDCDVTANPSVGVTPTIDVTAGTVTFDLDSDGDVLDCTFFNEKQTGAILITKTRKHAADGPGDHPHEGVEFTISGGSLTLPETVTTDADGEACLDGLVFSSIVGDYTVTETVPPGYVPDGEESKTVSVTLTSTCGDGNEATVDFSNTPLTDLTVEVDSHVDGGTASTIDCVVASGSTDANGDGLVTASDLQPGTYICTIVIDP